jgi:protease stability complex PrcB-like protein
MCARVAWRARSVLLAALALGATWSANACADPVPVERLRPDAPAFSVLSGIDEPGQFVLRNADNWAAIWQRIHGRSSPKPPVPTFDFDREMVIVATLGRQLSGGYAIRVERAYREGPTTVIVVHKESPGERCIVTNALTSPADVAKLPLSPDPVEFRFESSRRECN